MKDSIRQWATALLGGAALSFCVSAGADYTPGSGYTFNLGAEGIDVTVGADLQIRLEGYQRTVVDPEMVMPTSENGPAYEYLRLRERVWASVKVQDWMKFNVRLANRWQYFSSRPGENNNGMATWEFPDEVVFDQLNLQLLNIADSNWSLTIGRQELPLGNGMVFLEGTPADGGRTIYFDGISANWKTERDNLKLFTFYNSYRDRTLVINDQERALRRGDIFTAGADWTHTFHKAFSTELYYIGAKVNADTDTDKHNVGDTVLHTFGARLFGAPHEQIDYSLEIAREYGERQGQAHDADMSGTLIDARLTFKAPKDTALKPSVLLQYTYFSGDDPDTGDFEGWDPIFASYPIYREELLPTLLGGANWTNLHQTRIEGRLVFCPHWSAAVAYAYLMADEEDLARSGGRGGTGGGFGQLVTAFVDYKPYKWLSFALEIADFFPGSYWTDADSGIWGRFQTTLTF